jgi:hypothetical protein
MFSTVPLTLLLSSYLYKPRISWNFAEKRNRGRNKGKFIVKKTLRKIVVALAMD